MLLDEIATTMLLALSTFFGVEAIPTQHSDWQVASKFSSDGYGIAMTASSASIVSSCATRREGYIEFPSVIHGAHRVNLDGRTILTFGDPTFRTSSSFYGSPIIPCQDIADGHVLEWTVSSYTPYFARFRHFPKFASARPLNNLFQETLNIAATGSLVVMTLVAMLLFWGRVPTGLCICVTLSTLSFSGYFLVSVAKSFEIDLPMLTLHKIADFSMWLGSCFLLNSFRIQGLFGAKPLTFHFASVSVATMIFAAATTGDAVQLGTMVPFPSFFAIMGICAFRLGRQARTKTNLRHATLQCLSLGSFIFSAVNDFTVVAGLRDGVELFSIGIVAGALFLALDVNERIADTYRERDYLRTNLEREVAQKTQSLVAQRGELEITLASLKSTQAELIQSAKMASLGTLSAGIAHEINNSLNYVNGALTPLSAHLTKAGDFQGRDKSLKLVEIMRQGLDVTFGIIKSLRNYSGLNQAALRDHKLKDLVSTVLTITKSRVPEGVHIHAEIPEGIQVYVNAAGISQVLMNLIINSIDAVSAGGRITISAEETTDWIQFSVADNGSGIDEKTMTRIFEPFFTTKDVGKGSGLGLNICRKEIERHGGKIAVSSKVGVGTTFNVSLPRRQEVVREDAA